jgi:addiction module HigA family antidote
MFRLLTTTEEGKQMGRSAIHPGEHLAEQLEALEMSAAELSRQLGVPTNRITAILNGRRAITGDTALRLGHFFGNSPQFWLNLQALYDLRIAERKVGGEVKALPTLSAKRRTVAGRHARTNSSPG